VQEYVENQQSLLPAGIQMTTWQDDASYLRSRQELLVKNGFFGLALVFATLALFLDLVWPLGSVWGFLFPSWEPCG